MNLLIVTGMSGAGKSQAANALEDMGFYCVDNIPPTIIPAFIELSARGNEELGRLAIVTDVRGGDMFSSLSDVLGKIKTEDIDYKILFLDADDDVLIRRYKENRRKHPLCEKKGLSVSEAVSTERQLLSKIRFEADYVIDTSYISGAQLKNQLSELFFGNDYGGFSVLCKSFGFKYGTDTEADTVFDVRCLPNPFYVEELKKLTGLDSAVSDYVMKFDESKEFAKRIIDFLDYAVPLYIKEGKSRLVIAVGCTGGKHRSVTMTERLAVHVQALGYPVVTQHRDLAKI